MRSTILRTQASYQLAQVHRVRGDAAAAAHHLAGAANTAAAGRSAPFVWACRLTRAQLALDAGDRAAGRALLAEALADGRARGFTSVPLSSTAFALAGLCEEALDAGLEADYVRRLIRLHDLVPDPAHPGAERWPFAVRVTALGPFAVHGADGRALARSATRARPLELLKTLVALGGRDVAAPRLAELALARHGGRSRPTAAEVHPARAPTPRGAVLCAAPGRPPHGFGFDARSGSVPGDRLAFAPRCAGAAMKNAPLRRIASCLALGSSLLLVACDTGADPVTGSPSGTSSCGGGSSSGGTTGGATIDWNARPARRRESVASSSERSPTRRNREEALLRGLAVEVLLPGGRVGLGDVHRAVEVLRRTFGGAQPVIHFGHSQRSTER